MGTEVKNSLNRFADRQADFMTLTISVTIDRSSLTCRCPRSSGSRKGPGAGCCHRSRRYSAALVTAPRSPHKPAFAARRARSMPSPRSQIAITAPGARVKSQLQQHHLLQPQILAPAAICLNPDAINLLCQTADFVDQMANIVDGGIERPVRGDIEARDPG